MSFRNILVGTLLPVLCSLRTFFFADIDVYTVESVCYLLVLRNYNKDSSTKESRAWINQK